jgi:hypothetical protein
MILLFDHILRKIPCLYLLFYVQYSIHIFLLLTYFPYNKIDRPLHCHGKVIVFSHLFSRTLTLGLGIKVVERFHT